ncbi:MAG: PKD domain-containing protein, partial [Gammaproteobacteria bacterium]
FGLPDLNALLTAGMYPSTGAEISSPADGASVAQGQSMNLKSACLGYDGSNAFSYQWNFGSSGIADSSAANPSVTFNTLGTYTVTLTCTNSLGSASATSSITVTPAPSHGGGIGIATLIGLLLLQLAGAQGQGVTAGRPTE